MAHLSPTASLHHLRGLARAAMLVERAVPALGPLATILAAGLVIALLDLPAQLPGWLHAALLAAFTIGLAIAARRAWSAVSPPTASEIDRRLEAEAGLLHRPLAALADRPAWAAQDDTLWAAHQIRAERELGRLRPVPPRPALARRDRAALRGGVALLVLATFAIAGGSAPEHLGRSLWPRFRTISAVEPHIQAWITPPAYTGLPPRFLPSGRDALAVPVDSHLTVNVSGLGASASPALAWTGSAAPAPGFAALDAGSREAALTVTADGTLTLAQDAQALAAWTLTIIPNAAPSVRWPEPPGPAPADRGRLAGPPQTRLPWAATHAYGVVGLAAEFALVDRPASSRLSVPVPIAAGTRDGHGTLLTDLTTHPWAGLKVTGHLVARDGAGQLGRSDAAVFQLPARHFENPTARALIAVRRDLSAHPEAGDTAATELERITGLDDVWRAEPGGLVTLRAAIVLLGHTPTGEPGLAEDAAISAVQSRLWNLALLLEEGAVERTARALEQARRQMREALDPAAAASQETLEQRREQLEQALGDHLAAQEEVARKEPPGAPGATPPRDRPALKDLPNRLEALRQDTRAERRDAARQDFADLERMLDALRDGMTGRSQADRERAREREQRARKRAEGRTGGQAQVSVAEDIVRREGSLLDHAEARMSPPDATRPDTLPNFSDPLDPTPPEAPGRPQRSAEESAGRKRDQTVQRALRRALGEMMQRFGDLTGNVPPPLSEADRAMRDGVAALSAGDDPAATVAARQTIDALQKGAEAMRQQVDQKFGRGGEQDRQDGDPEGDQQAGDGAEGQDQFGAGQQPGSGDQDGAGTNPGQGQGGQLPPGRRRGPGRADSRLDPLGRPTREAGGGVMDGDVAVPEEREAARTRAIQDELRRRGADRTRPQRELDYIGRLLAPE